MIGRTLAHYEITELLGRGGMGEVYRARDPRLGRDVAIKILPPELTGDPERLARFRREARSLAALSHPNVAAIHGFEESEGSHFLVMELVEGEELGARLARGPLPVDEVTEIALQLASGIEAAHAAGIVHRDLKPGNVMLGADERVKILDFGLARAIAPDAEGAGDPDLSPTITAALTGQGVILGTAAYMSPEQANGRALDHRADIWSYGVILFEMLSGKRLFAGESVTDTLALVLRSEIDWSLLPAATPPRLLRLLRRCLARKPRQRLQAIGDARIELELHEPESLPTAAAPIARWWPALALLALAIGLFAGRQWQGSGSGTQEYGSLPLRRSVVPLAEATRLAGWATPTVALSPDGALLAYIGTGADGQFLYVRHMDSGEIRRVPDSEWAEGPFFSPDGRSIAFGAGQISGAGEESGRLKRFDSVTGRTQTICEIGDYFGGVWRPDGEIVYIDRQPLGFWKVAAIGGEPRPLRPEMQSAEQGEGLGYPQLLPDDRHAVLIAWEGREGGVVVIADTETGELQRLDLDATFVRYVPEGYLLLTRLDRQVEAVPFDASTRTVLPGRTRVLDVVSITGNRGAVLDVAADGTLVYSQGYVIDSRAERTELVWVGLDGSIRPTGLPIDFYQAPSVAPDGQRIAVSHDGMDLYVIDLTAGTRLRLPRPDDMISALRPKWTPDGQRLIFGSDRRGGINLFVQATDGVGLPRRIESEIGEYVPGAWLPDGTTMIYYGFRTADTGLSHLMSIDLADLEHPSAPQLLLGRDEEARGVAVSPRGDWIAYSNSERGASETYVRSYPDLATKLPVGGGNILCWAPDGSSIFTYRGSYFRMEGSLWRQSVDWSSGKPHFGPAQRVVERERLSYIDPQLTANGFLALRHAEGEGSVDELNYVQGWSGELEHLLPRR